MQVVVCTSEPRGRGGVYGIHATSDGTSERPTALCAGSTQSRRALTFVPTVKRLAHWGDVMGMATPSASHATVPSK